MLLSMPKNNVRFSQNAFLSLPTKKNTAKSLAYFDWQVKFNDIQKYVKLIIDKILFILKSIKGCGSWNDPIWHKRTGISKCKKEIVVLKCYS